MSHYQSKSDKSNNHYRKIDRSANQQQRSFSGKSGGTGGGSVTVPPPVSSSFNGRNRNAQSGGESKTVISDVNKASIDNSVAQPTAQNCTRTQPPLHASDTPVAGIGAKLAKQSLTQNSNQAVPKPGSSQSSTMSSGTATPTTPAKFPGDAPKPFAFQFGSLSPGIMNAMQIPARTSSAPPNFDEKKSDQAPQESLKPGSRFPNPVPDQPLPKKETGAADQPNMKEVHQMPKVNRGTQVSSGPISIQTQRAYGMPMGGGVPMPMPYHQSPIPVQFGAHAQFQPHPMGHTAASQMQQPMFVPNIQPQHLMHQHQGPPSLSYTPQTIPYHQIPPQVANWRGIGTAPQYPQHVAGNFTSSARRSVKITDPKTNKEVPLDHTQSNPSITLTRPTNSVPLTNNPQITPRPQAVRLTYPVNQGPRATLYVNVPPIEDKASSSSVPVSSHAVESSAQQPKPVLEGPSSVSTNTDGHKKEIIDRSNSMKDHQKKPEEKEHSQSQPQVDTQDHKISSSSSEVQQTAKATPLLTETRDGEVESISTQLFNTESVTQESSESNKAGHDAKKDRFKVQDKGLKNENIELKGKTKEEKLVSNRTEIENMNDKVRSKEGFDTLSDKDKQAVGPNLVKKHGAKSKKKRKESLQRADAVGIDSDLYMAYKCPDEKLDLLIPSEITNIIIDVKKVPKDDSQKKEGVKCKAEPDYWEDANTPKLEALDNGKPGHINCDEILTKKYSRDFLLKFSVQCTVPEGFEVTSDIVAVVCGASDKINSHHSRSARNLDRSTSGGPRADRRGNMVHDDKWNRQLHDNFGVIRNPRSQGGILSGPTQSMGAMQRNNADVDRWQRAAGFQKGLIPTPLTPLQAMHRAENKYEIGKVSDEEEAKQRQLKAILNKLTPQNFEKLFLQVKAVNIDNAITLTGVISQIFVKALTEPTFCEMYASFCHHLAGELPNFTTEDNEKITFKKLLLNKCQEEFERGEREQEEADMVEEGEGKHSKEEKEEKRVQARRRMLGNIRLIGELFKKRMLTEKIMHSCINKLLGQNQNPDEEDIEAFCKLMSTIGEMIDKPKAKEHMDAYFDIMKNLSNNMEFSSRVRFMLKDAIDLRRNRWQQRRKVEGPKKIEDVHRDAAQERHAQSQVGRHGRGSVTNSSARRDFGPRGSTVLSSPSTQMGNFRGVPQNRGHGNQDILWEERQTYEARPISSPPSSGDPRRMTGGMNGYNGSNNQTVYGHERLASLSAYEKNSGQERSMPYGNNKALRNSERSFDRSHATSSPTISQMQGQEVTQNNLPEKALSEERLCEMSIAAIREFYSAKDEKEIALCIKELSSPSFHPTMVSVWVTDSFERKDMERDLLAKLLVSLIKSQDGLLTPPHLLKGFESVLQTFEDVVNDAPKAAEFLGRIFAKTILENITTIDTIGQLIHNGGEEPGSLLEAGIAADVLGSILEMIQLEKGDVVLKEIQSKSNLNCADFRSSANIKSGKLDKFI